MSEAGVEARTVDEAALWRVDLADIAKQTDVPTEVLLGALMGASATPHTPRARPGCALLVLLSPSVVTSEPVTISCDC